MPTRKEDLNSHPELIEYNNSQYQENLPRTTRNQPMKKAATYLSLVLLGAGAALGGNYLVSDSQSSVSVSDSLSSVAIAQEPTSTSQIPTTNGNFITAVVEQVGPAVVRIDSQRTVENQIPDAFNDPYFRQFFGSRLEQIPETRVERGTGSGFIINQDGQIITNAHVIDGADTVTVTLKDGRNFEGKVLGVDPVTDLAVVKIDAENLPTVALGNSDQLKPGESAIAIGNPLGLDNTVTEGIISATGRSSSDIGAPNQRGDFIQTDAAINPGNSGGPLLNQQGQVIGVNTAIIQGAQGLGFAIPINTAQRIADQLIATGKVDHAYIGVQMVALTPEIKEQINSNPNAPISVDQSQGILVVKVVPDSPAARAGIRAGDVIEKINSQTLTAAEQLQNAVDQSGVGKTVQLEVSRNGQTRDVTVQLGTLPVANNN